MPLTSIRSLTLALAAAVTLVAAPAPAFAQMAEQTVRIVFPFAAGGSGDALARLIAEHLRTALNQPVIVDARRRGRSRVSAHRAP